MALGEAHIIALTKRALGDAGADVGALEAAAAAGGSAAASAAVPRSSTVLLAKNLPYAVSEAELVELFGQCGPLARLVLPPTRALALVEFEVCCWLRLLFGLYLTSVARWRNLRRSSSRCGIGFVTSFWPMLPADAAGAALSTRQCW